MAEEGKRAARINLHTVHNIHKVVRNLEVTVKNAHVRVEEPAREVPVPLYEAETEAATGRRPATSTSTSTSTPAVAFGICLRGVSLGLDERAGAGAGGGSAGERWFGEKFRAMETALLGNFCEILMADGSRCGGAARFVSGHGASASRGPAVKLLNCRASSSPPDDSPRLSLSSKRGA